MFKADAELNRIDGSNEIRYLADFVLSTLMLKKLTETAFCVTKNRFFLIRFLICVDRTTARVLSPSRRELAYYNILLLTASRVLMHFFGIFSDFFLNFRKRISLSDSLLILSH